MALTQISTQGIKDGTITGLDLATNVDLVDGQFIRLGTGNDMSLYHDGTNSIIANITGPFALQSNDLQLTDVTNSHPYIKCVRDAQVELYHDNSKKFETKSSGVNVTSANDAVLQVTTTGTASTDDARLELITQESTFIIQNDRSLGTDGALTIGDGTDTYLQATKDAEIGLYFNNSKKFHTNAGGCQIFGNLFAQDNNKHFFGDSNDLEIFHNGTDSLITDTGTGSLALGGSAVFIQNNAHNANMASFVAGAEANLFFNGSKKFETTSAGVTISGDLTFSDSTANDINLRGGKIFGDDGASNEFTLQNTSGNSNHAKIVLGESFGSDNGGITFYGAGSSTSEVKLRIRGNTDTVEIPDNHKFVCGDGSDLQIFYDSSANSKIQSNGSLTITHSNGDKFIHCSSNSDVELYHDGTKRCNTDPTGISVNGRIHTQLGTNNNSVNKTTTGKLVSLMTDGTERGNISSNGSTVQFNTSASDKSLKKNFEDWTENTLNLFKNINAQKFNFLDQEDGTDKEKGFIAQDMVVSFPEAYQKNDDDKYMFNPSGMVVYLMKAIQELEAEVAALKAG